MFRISPTPLEIPALRATLADARAGACVTFEGWVRDHNEGQAVQSLEYEAYVPLAEAVGTLKTVPPAYYALAEPFFG